MSLQARMLSLILAGVSIGGVVYYFVFGATASIYVAWVSMILAWTIMIVSMASHLSRTSATQAALVAPFMLAVGSFIASAFRDTLMAWLFLIAATVSFPLILALVRRLSSSAVTEDQGVSETHEGLLRWVSVGITTIIAIAGVGYFGWRVWSKVSANVLMLATILLIVLAIFGMTMKRLDRKPKRWLSLEGLFVLSGLLNELLFPVFLVLLLLNIAVK